MLVHWTELQTAIPNCLARNTDASLSKQIFDISKTQREPMVQPDVMADDFISDLGKKYGVSTQALVNRLKNLGYIQE